MVETPTEDELAISADLRHCI